MVVEATYETLANPRLIDKLATLILNAHQQKMADASVINIIEGQLHDTEKALSNLIACMEKGIVSASTAKRLE